MIEIPEILIKQEMLSHRLAERSPLADGAHLFFFFLDLERPLKPRIC